MHRVPAPHSTAWHPTPSPAQLASVDEKNATVWRLDQASAMVTRAASLSPNPTPSSLPPLSVQGSHTHTAGQ